jgi:hypothetical protein
MIGSKCVSGRGKREFYHAAGLPDGLFSNSKSLFGYYV